MKIIKKITAALIFFIGLSLYSQQEKINNYKYVIVSDKFDFLKTSDQYQTSSLTKFLLEKKGFITFLSNDNLPTELLQNKCLALAVNVLDASNILTTKNKIQFKDCYGTVLYTSEIGKSKEKNYKKGYHEAIRNAFNSMTDLVYQFKEEIVAQNISNDVVNKVMINSKAIEKTSNKKKAIESLSVLYAQTIKNGFQLVNTKPELVFRILKTNVDNVFIIKNKNGILYKKNTIWVAEYYQNDRLVTENFQVKF